MIEPDISIVIPVYNTEKFLGECLNSVIYGIDASYEIIIINDGSTDDSDSIIGNFAQKYDNIKYIKQNNCGLSDARNKGLNYCTGRYTFFLDSDDLILSDDFNELLQVANETNADVIIGNILTCVEKRTRWLNYQALNHVPNSYALVSSEEYCNLLLSHPRAYAPMVFNCLYRTNFLKENRLLFQEGIIHEDELWTPQILISSQTIAVSSACHYFYRIRPGSIMTTSKIIQRKASLEKIIPQLQLLLRYCREQTSKYKFLTRQIFRLNQLLEEFNHHNYLI